MENPTICLNMIVKDEADIIVNTLSNITNKIPVQYTKKQLYYQLVFPGML